jgi:heterodisulfide reductase subunit A2
MAKVNITIDGQPAQIEEGTYVLQAAQELGIEIPTLCYYPYMPPYAACRICAVEARDAKGWTKVVTACNYPVWEGLNIYTGTPRVLNARRVNLEMLLSQCAPAPVLQKLADDLGITEPRWGIGTNTCIKCGLCVRICDEVVGAHALAFGNRGVDREITTPFHLESDDCILCGACARYCPTGHIQMTDIGDRILHSELMLGPNAAIRIPFRQAIPNVPRIYTNQCIHMKTGGCMLCAEVCPKDAINFDALSKDTFEELEIGAIVVATGFQDFDPTPMKQYGYGRYANVISALEFEQMNNAASPTNGKIVLENGEEPKAIAILHCIGSRDENYHKYCSRVCCMYALKFAHLVKEKTNAEVYQLYIDMRAFGKGYEEFYHRLLDEGVNVIRGKGAEVVPARPGEKGKHGLFIRCEDTLVGEFREIPVDMVVLCTALEARSDASEFGRKLNISTGADGWYIEAHPKLAPVSTTTEGIFLAGVCQGPKDIPDSVAQGSAAGCQVLRMFGMGELYLDAAYAVIDEETCSGCRICNGLCPYTAITYDEEKKVSIVNAALCKACGTCVAACPSGSIKGRHFTDEQIYAQIEGILA